MQEPLATRLGRVLIVGGGSMGRAICAGLLRSCGVRAQDVTVANPGAAKREALSADFGVACVEDGVQGLPADTVFLAVKPAKVADLARRLADAGLDGALVVSIAAGVSTAALSELLGPKAAVVRVMPNTPLQSGAGMAGVSAGVSAGEADAELVREVFAALGGAVVVDEALQDAVTAVSGSGPAYFELVVEQIARAGEELGLAYEDALELALQTMYGTAVMLKETGQPLDEAIAAVSSPGGTTVAALSAMREGGLEEALRSGVKAAAARSAELGR